jgi:hypothetical protein
VPTEDEIMAARTPKGAWTKKQLAEWGVPWPPPRGWKRRLIIESGSTPGTFTPITRIESIYDQPWARARVHQHAREHGWLVEWTPTGPVFSRPN